MGAEHDRDVVVVVLKKNQNLFLTFSALVANPKKLLYTVANPARGLLNRGKKKKKMYVILKMVVKYSIRKNRGRG